MKAILSLSLPVGRADCPAAGAAGPAGAGAEAALPPAAVAEAEPVQPLQQPQEYLTSTITYTYDPLHRLTGAVYSTSANGARSTQYGSPPTGCGWRRAPTAH